MLKSTLIAVLFAATLGLSGPLQAQSVSSADPTADQIYQAAAHGRLGEAEQMVERVLRDHPESAKAHYVAAEVYAKAGDASRARQELGTAERLKPGLPFTNPKAVADLKAQLGASSVLRHTSPESSRFSFPWGLLLLIGGAVALVWVVMSRRRAQYQQYTNQFPATAAGPQFGAGPQYGPNVGPMGGAGIGSGLAGGLASGLAVGAGVVAGEELARHFLDRDQHSQIVPPPDREPEQHANADMGGNDFGLDAGESNSWDESSSWDDGGSFGGDSGGDWS